MLVKQANFAQIGLVLRLTIITNFTNGKMNISIRQPEDTLWSQGLVNTINIVCNCFGVNCVCIFGIVGNIVNIIVLYRHGFRDSTNILLFSLSVSDLFLVFTLPIGRLHGLVSQFDPMLAISIQSTATVALLTINRSLLFASIDHIGVISIERFVAIFFPFHVSRIFTANRMTKIVASIYVINFTILSPWFGAFYLGVQRDPASNKTVAYAHLTRFYSNNENILNTYGAVTNVLSILLNLALVTISCLAIAIKLFINNTKRGRLLGTEQSKRSSAHNAKVSKMLLTLCVVFYVTFFPTTVLDMYLYFTVAENLFVDRRYVVMQYISGLVYCINSSINFIIYVTMSKKYYHTYSELITCCKKNIDT